MKKIIFLDRDGTIIDEPQSDFQVDAVDKFRFKKDVIHNLYKIQNYLEYDLVMVSNQDGLGTESFPQEVFSPLQELLIDTLLTQGITFREILIDSSFDSDNSKNRKPNIGIVKHYLSDSDIDIKNSYVIGDRESDLQFAANLGCKSILLNSMDIKTDLNFSFKTQSWNDIYAFLNKERSSTFLRKTNETDIELGINLYGNGVFQIDTGLSFLDHMLEQISKHSNIDIFLKVRGDLKVDEHHTIEDVAIVLGKALKQLLGNKIGISRYGYLLPMDESLSQIAIDFSGRSHLEWDATFKREKIGDVPTEMFFHFFKTFSDECKCTLHIKNNGKNEHHKIESIFKCFALSIKSAIQQNSDHILPSTKGLLS